MDTASKFNRVRNPILCSYKSLTTLFWDNRHIFAERNVTFYGNFGEAHDIQALGGGSGNSEPKGRIVAKEITEGILTFVRSQVESKLCNGI